jgi:hypothetical protein
MVDTPDGPRPIEGLRVGDIVRAIDTATRMFVDAPVVRVTSSRRECVALLVGDVWLRCTPDHPLFDPDSNGFRPAGLWIEGRARRVLRVVDGVTMEVDVEHAKIDGGMEDVFDLTVGGAHPTFVAAGVVVHNKTVPDPWEYMESMEGPTVGLSPAIPVERFEIRPCLQPAEDIRSRVKFEAWSIAGEGIDTAAGTPRVALAASSVGESEARLGDSDVGGAIWLVVDFDELTCTEGIVLEFRYTTPELGGQVEVGWEAQIQVDPDFDGGSTLEIAPLP